MSYHTVFLNTKSLGVAFINALERCLGDSTKAARRAEVRSFSNVLRGLHIIDSRPVLFIADAVNPLGETGLLIVQAGEPSVSTTLDSSGEPLNG